MISIVDYGLGNIASIHNMVKKIGYPVIVTSSKKDLFQSKKIILPGVGHFDYGMQNLKKLGLVDILNNCVLEMKIPILGICLGAQLFGRGSEEGNEEGLNWINMESKKFKLSEKYRIPHMGWNEITTLKILQYLTNIDLEDFTLLTPIIWNASMRKIFFQPLLMNLILPLQL